ncbi:hypothetical protein [Dyella sp. Tek66A03]|uniref:hypothetical protein n=1 Tax=Dyella sp. Tek66A03 TaxID=3458298 RepID=UPI00403E9092
MVDVTRFEFSHEEIITSLIRQLGINEGLWTINARFTFEAQNLRAKANDPKLSPGFVGVIQQISLVKVTNIIPGLTIDAAKVNPKPYLQGPATKQ